MKHNFARALVALAVASTLIVAQPAHAVSTTIVINEVDCHGNDWIEIGNRSSQSIDISGWLLSDKKLNSTAAGHVYTFPTGTRVAAKGRLVIQQSGTGAAHLGFGVSCVKGGTIKLGYRNGSSIAEVDSVNVPVIAPQTSYARLPDFIGGFSQAAPTKNATNYGVKPIMTSATTVNCLKGRVCKITLRSLNAPKFRLARAMTGVTLSSTGVLSVSTSKVAVFRPSIVMTNTFGTTTSIVTVNVKLR